MKTSKILLVLLCSLCLGAFGQSSKTKRLKKAYARQAHSAINSTKFTVTGKLTNSYSYCGGAEPSKEIMDEYSRPKPYEGKVLHLRKGTKNSTTNEVLLDFTTDKNGQFSFQISPGIYSIIQTEQVKVINMKDFPANQSETIDETCLNAWWLKPLFIIEVKDKDISGLDFNFYHSCFVTSDIPCVQYNGPMPP